MPESSGEEVLGQVRRIRADVAVVLSSGFGGARPGWPEPASASFLKKPYTTDELIGSLSEAISRVSRAAGS